MKKSLAVLSILACMFGLCACGSQNVATNPLMTAEEATQIGTATVDNMNAIVLNGMIDQYAEDPVSYAGLTSWESSLEDIGEYNGVKEVTSDITSDEAVIDVLAAGSEHDAIVEMILSKDGCTSISTTVQYSTGEMMAKAGLNTLIGMGTVFVVLVLISLIISCFNLIPKVQEMFSNKKKADKEIKADAVDNTIAQIIEKEELSDDLELVAVIAAAIAASEGTGTDDFVVRSIRRRA